VSVTPEVAAAVGDLIEVSGRRVGDSQRSGEILDVLGPSERPHYLVRWDDGHESVFYPGEATTIRKASAPPERPTPPLDVAAATQGLVELLRAADVEFELLPHRRTMRAAAEARVLGVVPQTVAKTLVLRDGGGRCIRAVVPATRRVSLEMVAKAIGAESVRLLTESELVTAYPQFELGAVPPFGGPAGDLVVVDVELAGCDHVVLEAGVHDTSLRMRTDDLLEVADAKLETISAA
jgi:Ala-tRNA(Pro) deacylase